MKAVTMYEGSHFDLKIKMLHERHVKGGGSKKSWSRKKGRKAKVFGILT